MSSMNMHIHRLLREQAPVSRRKRLSFVLPTLESDRNLPTSLSSNNNSNKIDWFQNLDRKKNASWTSVEEKWKNRLHKLPKNMTGGAKGWKFLSRQFCKTTSLHGFNFFIDNENPLVERIFWMMALILVYACCGYLIRNSIQAWVSSRAVMSMENSPTTVASVPFPAITICNTNQIKSTVFNISAYLELKRQPNIAINHSYLHQLDYSNILCNRELDHDWNTNILDNSIFLKMMNNAHETCREIFLAIKWTNETFLNPCELIQPILTDLGMCFSFNMLPFKVLLNSFYFEVLRLQYTTSNLSSWSQEKKADWTPQEGYRKPIRAKDIPRRTAGAGNVYAFTALMNLNYENYDSNCNSGTQGYTVLIHSPADFPSSTNAQLAIGQNSSEAVTIQPKILRTSKEIENWNPEDRGCYFDEERHLHYFKLYTQTNCYLECESNYSLHQCGCVAYYHPRELFTPICGSVQMDCIEDALVRLAELNTETTNRICNCLPSCTTLQYECSDRTVSYIPRPDLESTTEDENITYIPVNFYSDKSINDSRSKFECIFTVYYRDRDTLGIVRVGFLTFSDFLGNIGGILGLFLGFSWISLLELIHFIILRPILSSRKESI